jgi:threonine dehydrogenase-like Zn-dependent dehydrogenase
MGLLHLLVLRAVHPGLQVLVADRIPERLERARELGATIAREPGEAGLRAAVEDSSGGLGADAVFDTVGGAGLLELALGLAREGGTAVLFAHAPRGERAGFELNDLFKHERRVVGTYSSTLAEQEEVYRLIVSGRLDASPLVTHRLPLSRFQEAVDLSRARKALKVLLVPG